MSLGCWLCPAVPAVSPEVLARTLSVPRPLPGLRWLRTGSSHALAVCRWLSSLHGSLFPHLSVSLGQGEQGLGCRVVPSSLKPPQNAPAGGAQLLSPLVENGRWFGAAECSERGWNPGGGEGK